MPKKAEEFEMAEKPHGSGLSRRAVMRSLAAAASYPLAASGNSLKPTIGVIGGGMAGISLAWLLDGAYDVVLFEARAFPGGNVRSVPVSLDGYTFAVDLGAQFFHPKLYPTYVKLLEFLGIYPSGVHTFPASITLAAFGSPQPLFVSPILPGRIWPALASWNQSGIQAFDVAFQAAKQREDGNASWALTLEQWLPTLGLTSDQWKGMILPWAASIFSGQIAEAGQMSARAAMIFAAKALPDKITDPLLYYVLNQGMAAPLLAMLGQISTAQILTRALVTAVVRNAAGGFQIVCADGRAATVDQVVFASSGPPTLRLLQNMQGMSAQSAALENIAFRNARLALHTDPIYAPANSKVWSFLNSGIHGGFCEASMWMGDVINSVPQETAARVWKSWDTHRLVQPQQILAEAHFQHMLPTPATLAAQVALLSLQGEDSVWFAGGYTRPYDSQETALVSALGVAQGLGAASERVRLLTQTQ
jgi:uncharacterized protein